MSARTTVARALRSVAPRRDDLKRDALAGVPDAIGGVPDGMAAAVLVGVNPVHGLYAAFAGRVAGGLTSSERLVVITTTSSAALAAGSALRGTPAADRPGALFLLTLLAGVAMIVAGVCRLGRYPRFVPHSVMIGFLSGLALNIAFGQLADLTGVVASGSIPLTKALYVVAHPGQIDGPSLAVGLAALSIIALLRRSHLARVGALIAVVLPSIVAATVWADQVLLVSDEGAIKTGLPVPALPHLRYLDLDLITGALAVAAIVLVQGAGVSESAPNPRAEPSRPNREFLAQGIGNVAASLVQGQPVGGSIGQTALNRASGAASRWAAIFSGLWIAVVLLVLSPAVGKVAIPTLAGLLIFAAIGSLRPREARAILRTSTTSRIALIATFVATLLLPVATAVGIGVALSLVMQLNQEALDLRVVRLQPRPDGRFEEQPAPLVLPSDEVTVLDVYGSLLYAGARTLQVRLPDVGSADRPVVVLRLRGRTALGATFFVVISEYAAKLAEHGGRLYLSGADPELVRQMHRNGKVELAAPVAIYEASAVVGESTAQATEDARTWLIEHHPPVSSDPPPP